MAQERLQEARQAASQGNWGLAADRYRAVLKEETQGHDEAFHILSTIAYRTGKIELALQLADAALEISPGFIDALTNKSVYLRLLHRYEDAYQTALHACAVAPTNASAWHTAGFLDMEAKRYDQALIKANKAVELEPTHGLAQANLANALMVSGALAEAFIHAQKACDLMPQEALSYFTLGQVIQAAGYPALAIPYFQKAYEIKPDYLDAHSAEASALTVMGQWEESWFAWEQRPLGGVRAGHLPRWQGEQKTHLFLYAEQGMGDGLQFLRFVPQIVSAVDQLVFQVPAPLKKMVTYLFPNLNVITPQEPLPEGLTSWMPLMSAPYLFKTSMQDLPAPTPISLPQSDKDAARTHLAQRERPRIGLIWAGNPDHPNDFNRSVPFEKLRPLVQDFSVHLISFQNGKIALFEDNGTLKEIPFEHTGDAVWDSACLLSEMDLVISVDTMPAHLAACLGIPVWLLIPFEPDGRWLYERQDTVWYPMMKLYRQTRPKAWDDVVTRVCVDLQTLLSGNGEVLLPRLGTDAVLTQNPNAVPLPLSMTPSWACFGCCSKE